MHDGLKLSAYLNGVAKLPGAVSREMWHKVWPNLNVNEVPITSITNGVHSASWVSHEYNDLYKKYLNNSTNVMENFDKNIWNKVQDIPADELWNTHNLRKDKLIKHIHAKAVRQAHRMAANLQTFVHICKQMLQKCCLVNGIFLDERLYRHFEKKKHSPLAPFIFNDVIYRRIGGAMFIQKPCPNLAPR